MTAADKFRKLAENEPFELDCGDNSCYYAKNKTGMRTNGGCRCVSNKPRDVERYWRRKHHAVKPLLDLAAEAFDALEKSKSEWEAVNPDGCKMLVAWQKCNSVLQKLEKLGEGK